ncbi:SH3 domain-containing protein [Pantoea ananatis]|uniref:SH3 domain-containing protein n=1 Tax=Pantoea ananas TaxID=553 RepID=UPI000B1B4EB8|nr:SH3 domain-containing protein [Pantoea ananatis]
MDQQFVTEWLTLADKNLGGFIKEPVSVHEGGQYYFTARPGTILPFRNRQPGFFDVTVPVRKSDGRAQIRQVRLQKEEFVAMPWEMTPGNMAVLMKSMSGRPYGWGNYNFYNDCSAEMRSLMMPFGIFLPRNSAAQIQSVARIVDLSQENTRARLRYLTEHGSPFSTLVYIPGVSVSSRPSSISARVSYHGHFREHGHYRGQKHALHQSTLDHHCTQPAV